MADRLESAWDNEAGGSPLLTHTQRVDALVRSAYHRCLLVLAVEQGAARHHSRLPALSSFFFSVRRSLVGIG